MVAIENRMAEIDGAVVERAETRELSGPQMQAAVTLLGGKSVTRAAEAAGVHRSTVQRWKRDEAFAAFLEEVRNEMRQTIAQGLLLLGDEVVACIAHSLSRGDGRLALQLATKLGAFEGEGT